MNAPIKVQVSVIVCCYRGEKTIGQCIQALVEQHYPIDQYEILIIDDGSVDGSARIIKNFLESRNGELPYISYHRKENEGLAVARNDGISMTHGSLIAFVDEDAIAHVDFLREIDAVFRDEPQVNCVGGTVEILNPEYRFADLLHRSVFQWYMSSPQAIIGTNMAFRKEFLMNVGGFQSEFRSRGDETAFFVKAGSRLRTKRCQSARVRHRQPSSVSEWMRVQIESGYYEAAKDLLARHLSVEGVRVGPKAIARAFRLVWPLVIVVGLVISTEMALGFLAFYAILWSRRYIVDQVLTGPLAALRKSSNAGVQLRDYLLLIFAIVVGGWNSDRGYIEGYFNFRHHIWNTASLFPDNS